jgi:hypothetical protein
MVRLKSEFLSMTIITECQDFLTIKTFMSFVIPKFVNGRFQGVRQTL